MDVLRIVIDVLIAVGAIFALAGTIGLLKMPDIFSRMQASTCISTMGVIGVAIGAWCFGEEALATCWVMCKPGSRVEIRATPDKGGISEGWLECGDSFETDAETEDGWIHCIGVGDAEDSSSSSS